MNNSRGLILILSGLLLFAAAGSLISYNILTAHMAEKSSISAARQLEAILAEMNSDNSPSAPSSITSGDIIMPTATIEGQNYIGILEIPAIGLCLPVIGECSNESLKLAPCRYAGSVYTNDLILAGHNYTSHFAGLSNLTTGNSVCFTAMDGRTFHYEVVKSETLLPTAVEQMESGGWDLTLFTCTYGGKSRVTVRCTQTEAISNNPT